MLTAVLVLALLQASVDIRVDLDKTEGPFRPHYAYFEIGRAHV